MSVIDSPVATEHRIGLLVAQGKARKRTAPPVAIVIHTTGGGPVKRVVSDTYATWRARWPAAAVSPFEAACWVFTAASPASGHYVVGQAGECVQVVPEDLIAWHVGAKDAERYSLPLSGWCAPDLRWWPERWPGLSSPVELAGGRLWRGGSCNGASIGIEVAPSVDDPTGPWSDACWRTLVALVSEICLRREIPCMRTHVVTHSDAHPYARTARGRPWDPSEAAWSWDEFAQRSGGP